MPAVSGTMAGSTGAGRVRWRRPPSRRRSGQPMFRHGSPGGPHVSARSRPPPRSGPGQRSSSHTRRNSRQPSPWAQRHRARHPGTPCPGTGRARLVRSRPESPICPTASARRCDAARGRGEGPDARSDARSSRAQPGRRQRPECQRSRLPSSRSLTAVLPILAPRERPAAMDRLGSCPGGGPLASSGQRRVFASATIVRPKGAGRDRASHRLNRSPRRSPQRFCPSGPFRAPCRGPTGTPRARRRAAATSSRASPSAGA